MDTPFGTERLQVRILSAIPIIPKFIIKCCLYFKGRMPACDAGGQGSNPEDNPREIRNKEGKIRNKEGGKIRKQGTRNQGTRNEE